MQVKWFTYEVYKKRTKQYEVKVEWVLNEWDLNKNELSVWKYIAVFLSYKEK